MDPLVICSVFRNEAPYLKEWIDFHLQQGVSHFYLYNNKSTDEWEFILDYDCVTVYDWPHDPPCQQTAFSDFINKSRTLDDIWIAFIDVDEFLFAPDGKQLPQLLLNYERFPAVAVNWLCFGNNGHAKKPNGSVLDSYTLRTDTNNAVNKHVKCIVRASQTVGPGGTAHVFKYISGYAVNANGERVNGPFSRHVRHDILRINHYLTKSSEEAAIRSRKGRIDIANGDRDNMESIQQELNLYEDKTILDVRDRASI